MTSYREYFKGKRITLMGLGLLGRGVGDARFLAEQGAKVIVTDLKSEEDLKESLRSLKDLKNISFVLGEHRMEDFEKADLVIKGAGVPLNSPYIEKARLRNVPVRMSAALFAEFSPARIVGVTGTKGKTTVSFLLHHILKEAGENVFLGGNARLISTLAHLPESKEDEIAVLELDSWQLQGFAEARISPSVSVFTNFMPDHLNYYKGDMDAYFHDKAQIFAHQKKENTLILTEELLQEIKERYKGEIKSEIDIASPNDVSEDLGFTMVGQHNRLNASLALKASRVLGVSNNKGESALRTFGGVSGRLDHLGSFKQRRFYNDNNATAPEATVASILALKEKGGVILIAGGANKDLPLEGLRRAIENSVFKAFLLPGSGTDRLREMTDPSKIEMVSDIREALKRAYSVSKEGDAILFSPAFASFSQFKNEYEREKKLLEELEKGEFKLEK
ncbi:MAG: UDP-N-acetylmuramoyl-L-alanine--D-glutamate ligase [Patescibacteria group bacterium]